MTDNKLGPGEIKPFVQKELTIPTVKSTKQQIHEACMAYAKHVEFLTTSLRETTNADNVKRNRIDHLEKIVHQKDEEVLHYRAMLTDLRGKTLFQRIFAWNK